MVEDEEDVRLLLEYELRDLGQELVATGHAKRKMQKKHQRRFDIVITDIRMPGMDGI